MGWRQEDQKLAQLSSQGDLGAQIRVMQVVMGEQGQLTKETKQQKDLMFPASSKEEGKAKTILRMALRSGFVSALVFSTNPQ